MKTSKLKTTAYIVLSVLLFSTVTTGCSKSSDSPSGYNLPVKDYGTHKIDAKLKGTWQWTSGSDIGYNDDNGTWQGGGYGFAFRANMDAKGNGTLYSYVYSDLGGGSRLEVDIYYTGYFEMDDEGNLTFYSMGGRYVSSSGTDRALSGNEIYDAASGTGRTVYFPAIQFKTVNNKDCFTTTGDGIEEFFWKQ